MGLDVYLYHYKKNENFKSLDRALISYENIESKIKKAHEKIYSSYGDYSDLSESEKEKMLTETRNASESIIKGTPWEKSINMYGDLEFTAEEEIKEKDSTTNPEHLFKIGYFRSSYNSGGINHVLRNNGVMDLYEIFGVSKDEYRPNPNWKKSLENVKKAIEMFSPIAKAGIACMEVSSGFVKSEKEAIELYKNELSKKPSFDSYSSSSGTFYLGKTPVMARAFIQGKNCIGIPCTYVIYEVSGDDGLNWYIDALKIVQETIEWVLSQPDPSEYYFHWSG